ncbi:MAG TPA: tripartite tricarboxylate transporter substrate binding protein [Bordetella sp.]
MRNKTLAGLLTGLFLALGATPVLAGYPDEPLRLVVPYPPAGITDIAARALAKGMSADLKQNIIVENRAGAGGSIGTAWAAHAAPDGYTILMGTSATHGTNPTTLASLNYDAVKDFAAVSLVASAPLVVEVNPSLPVHNIREFIDYLKKHPDSVFFASTGTGGSVHLSVEYFKLKTGTSMQHVPYKGSAPALSDLVGGQVQVMFDNIPSSAPLIKGGKLRALAVTSTTRIADLPDVPTVSESGVPGFETGSWVGIYAPAGTPPAVVERLNKAVNAALQDPAVRTVFANSGLIPKGDSSADFAAFTKREIDTWADVARQIHYVPQ